jgi:dTMP kinase
MTEKRTGVLTGKLITFEGVDGAGKTTQVALTGDALERRGYSVLTTREPGGTRLSEQIRGLLLDPQFGEMAASTEALLYAAARSQLVEEVILPALKAGMIVLCDRFVDSSLAYQGFGRQLDPELLCTVNAFALAGLGAFYTILFDLEPEQGLQRFEARKSDRLEQEGLIFQQRVRDGYRALAAAAPERIRVVDGSGPPDEVQSRAWPHVAAFIEGREQGAPFNGSGQLAARGRKP